MICYFWVYPLRLCRLTVSKSAVQVFEIFKYGNFGFLPSVKKEINVNG